MRGNLAGAVIRLGIFVLICVVGIFAIFAVFAQLRFQKQVPYKADFTNVSGLREGNFVRIAGVEVGKVKKISMRSDAVVEVDFTTDESVVLTQGSKAVIRWDNLIGGRFLELAEGTGGVQRLKPDEVIPVSRTEPAVDLDALVGGFRPLFRALDPEQVNALTSQLISVFQGQGTTVGSFLAQTASVTNTLADRDQLIGEVITNLNTVLGTLADQGKQFGKAVDSLSELVSGLAERRTDIAAGLAHANAAAVTITDLLAGVRPSFSDTIRQGDRVGSIMVSDHDYLENLIDGLPEKYRALSRQGLFGDFFSFYLCDLVLKVNGKNGQPVYVKVIGQDSGRCTPN